MNLSGLKPVKTDKDGPLYDPLEVAAVVANQTQNNVWQQGTAKTTEHAVISAQKIASDQLKILASLIDQTEAMNKKIADSGKSLSGKVRDSAAQMSDGIARFQKSIDLHKLEKQVELIERLANGMQALQELEKAGFLQKISKAISA